MAGLLPADAEAVPEQLDVVARGLGGAQELGVGHEHRRREVAGQRHAAERAALVAGEDRVVDERVDERPALEQPHLVGELEVARAAAQHLGQQQLAPRRVVAAHRAAHLLDGGDAHHHAVAPPQVVHQPAEQPLGLEPRVHPQPLGRLLERREVVAVLLQQVAHLLARQPHPVEPAHLGPELRAERLLRVEHALGERLGRGPRVA
jgi:hypothetical protein